MRILIIGSDREQCGIAEHTRMLVKSLRGLKVLAVHGLELGLPEGGLNPADVLEGMATTDEWNLRDDWKLLHLNYHAALHSRWTPDVIRTVQAAGVPVVITYHDTGVPNSEQCKALHAVADAFVVQEPVEDLPGAIYIRQGVPIEAAPHIFPSGPPIVGSCGFAFPWKNFGLLARMAQVVGWRAYLSVPSATPDQVKEWTDAGALVDVGWRGSLTLQSYLNGCDATAFPYTCANTGTSAAIRMGIATGKPVIASAHAACRQFRDLALDTLGRRAITWITPNEEGLCEALSRVPLDQRSAGMLALRHQERWEAKAREYVERVYQPVWERKGL